ncbi:hypothetical protein K8089_02540 [Aequorivita sp. F47161]|uniref:Uncharacterized protein n=1 Tax=Aequorivita vitellina TaxID=2874475 RepID=A0A9X1QWG8_9FLAO|nr:hypothetical protein [Aequorivita vitellina]MCG2417884.1 hypothetical protein [Aequorivita vitellina]
MMNNKSTKLKSARPATKTVMGFQTGKKNKTFVNLYLFLLTLVAVFSPFFHLFYLVNDKEGIFGYAYMSSFLYSLSLPLMALSFGLLLKFLCKYISTELINSINFISNLIIFLGFFFLIYTFLSIQDFSLFTYYLVLIACSITLTAIAHFLQKAVLTTEQRLKTIISKLFDFIILETPRKHVSEEKQIDYVISYEKIINEIGDE